MSLTTENRTAFKVVYLNPNFKWHFENGQRWIYCKFSTIFSNTMSAPYQMPWTSFPQSSNLEVLNLCLVEHQRRPFRNNCPKQHSCICWRNVLESWDNFSTGRLLQNFSTGLLLKNFSTSRWSARVLSMKNGWEWWRRCIRGRCRSGLPIVQKRKSGIEPGPVGFWTKWGWHRSSPNVHTKSDGRDLLRGYVWEREGMEPERGSPCGKAKSVRRGRSLMKRPSLLPQRANSTGNPVRSCSLKRNLFRACEEKGNHEALEGTQDGT